MANGKSIDKYLPLTHTTYYILLALISPAHGYGIMQLVSDMTRGEVELGPGTLYGALSKLTKQGLISKLDEAEDSRRKYYVITALGKEVIEAEYTRLITLVENSRGLIKRLKEEHD